MVRTTQMLGFGRFYGKITRIGGSIMEPITGVSIAAFLGACFYKAGEKCSEKMIETVFENKKELADNFTGLFRDEIITLGLSDATTSAEVQQQLEAKPEIAAQVQSKWDDNAKLVRVLREQMQNVSSQMTNIAKNVGAQGDNKIDKQVNNFS